MNWKVVLQKSVDSTNDEARMLGERGEFNVVVVADHQTRGRGRHGRSWESPPGENLYISLVIKDRIKLGLSGIPTLISSVSIHDTLRSLDLNPWIKWPNDVYIGDKKIAGVLNEVHPDSKGWVRFIVLGIGLNVNSIFKGTELEKIATSIREELGRPVDRLTVLMELLERMEENLNIYRTFGPRKIAEMWMERAGKGVTLEIDEGGSLVVKGGKSTTGEGELFLCSWE